MADLPAKSPPVALVASAVADAQRAADAGLRVSLVDGGPDAEWAAFVTAHPDGLIYHHPSWSAVLRAAYGYRPATLVCRDGGGDLVGVLPLFQTRGLFTGRRLISLPHTPTAGPLSSDDAAAAALIDAAIRLVGEQTGRRLLLKSPRAGLDRLVAGLAGVAWEPTYVVELPEAAAELRFGTSRNHAQIKRAVGKATRLGVRVRPAENEADLRHWYRLYVTTMRRHAVPPRPYTFFRTVWEQLVPQRMARLLLAERHEGGRCQLLAGSLFLMSNQTVCYAYNGSRPEGLDLRPNDAIHWQALHDAHRDGFRRYDLGEVAADDPGLARYKRKWGATPRRLYRYYYPPPRVLPQPSLRLARLHLLASAAWRCLPIPATVALGRWIYHWL
jgi:CelD/BcsL family acetyltransferase involved in cellulose biosynthesis